MAKLTNKQKAFVEEYLVDFNATRAAERAGYRGDENVLASQGSRLLRNVKVAEQVSEHLSEKAMTADEVLMRLAAMARGDISEFIHDYGAIDWEAVREKGYLIKKIHHKKGEFSRIELHDSQSALEKLGRALGIFVDKLDLTSQGERIESFTKIIVREYVEDEGD